MISTPRKLAIGISVFTLLAVFLALWLDSDPFAERYKRKSVNEWIDYYVKQGIEVPEPDVVHHFGTDAFPQLTHRLSLTDEVILLFKVLQSKLTGGTTASISIMSGEEEYQKMVLRHAWCKTLLTRDTNAVTEALKLAAYDRVRLFSVAEEEHPTNLVRPFLTNSNPLLRSNAAEITAIFALIPSSNLPAPQPTNSPNSK